jgi:GST-like protein
VKRWHDSIAARPAVERGVAVLAANQRKGAMTPEERENMFGGTQFAKR